MSCVTHIYPFDDIPLSLRNWRIGQRVYLPQRRSFQLYYLVTSKIGIHGLHLFTKPPLHCAEGIQNKKSNFKNLLIPDAPSIDQLWSFAYLILIFFASKKFSVGRLWLSDIKFLVSFDWSTSLLKLVTPVAHRPYPRLPHLVNPTYLLAIK